MEFIEIIFSRILLTVTDVQDQEKRFMEQRKKDLLNPLKRKGMRDVNWTCLGWHWCGPKEMRERGRGERAGARDGGGPRPSEARPTRRKLVDAVDWWTGRPLTGLRGAGAAEVASTRVWQDEEHGGGSPTREEWRRRRGWSRGEADATAGRHSAERAWPGKKRWRGARMGAARSSSSTPRAR